MGAWQPQTIRRFIQGFPTSAHTALVETDIGLGYLKAMGGGEGPHTLASEVVVTQLAAWFGLPTLDWAVITLDELDEIPFLDRNGNRIGEASPGPAFITRKEDGTTWGGSPRELKLLDNPQDISRLVVFDTWVLNCDRHARTDPKTRRRRKPNHDNVFLSGEAPAGKFRLKSIDHTHCIACGREWTSKLARVDNVKDARVFGLFPEFRGFLKRNLVAAAAADLRTITKTEVETMLNHVPKEWDVTRGARTALVDLLVGRASFVAENIENLLWPERELFSEDELENPE